MPKHYWEDFQVGHVIEHGPRLVTREEIVAFAQQFDPQPIHLDEEAARASMLGGMSASGWHSCALAMRLIADGLLRDADAMGSPGIEEVRWMIPLRPGDRITLRATVVKARASRSRPQIGFTDFRFELINQNGATIMLMTSTIMLGRRRPDVVEA